MRVQWARKLPDTEGTCIGGCQSPLVQPHVNTNLLPPQEVQSSVIQRNTRYEDFLLSHLRDLYDRRPPNPPACRATKSRTLIAGRPVTRSTPSAIRSYLPARFNAAIVTR